MHGVTDLPFRRLIRELSCGEAVFFVSEFLPTGSSIFLTPQNLKAAKFDNEESPFCMQLFGHNAEKLANAAMQAEELGAAFIELNAGCPAPKVANKGSGSGLLRDLPKLQKILQLMKANIKVPLFLKCRLGWDENSICINEVLEIAEGCGVQRLTIHGRTRAQGYKGLANWNAIGEIAAKAKIPIIGNGDINSAEKALNAIKNYCVKGISIGRAALHNPWIFFQISNAMKGEEVTKISASKACSAVLRYNELMQKENLRQGQILGRLKQFSARFCKGFLPAIPEFRLKVLRCENYNEFLEIWLELKENCAGINFLPQELQNLNGQSKDEIEFGVQFKSVAK